MKKFNLLLLACITALAVGCGEAPAEVADPGEEMSTSSEELSACTASCAAGSVSCPTGTTNCSAVNGQGVTCDGTFYACPTCNYFSCASQDTLECAMPGYETPCCRANGSVGRCRCGVKRWSCF
ncbi:hypothetical protein NVS55_11605 [Myxococcus stipitatus]|uniref:hypothetical protein n=1 Tax=Myxococcus stipitatus TaxID=83455 RepID=UPI003144E29D